MAIRWFLSVITCRLAEPDPSVQNNTEFDLLRGSNPLHEGLKRKLEAASATKELRSAINGPSCSVHLSNHREEEGGSEDSASLLRPLSRQGS